MIFYIVNDFVLFCWLEAFNLFSFFFQKKKVHGRVRSFLFKVLILSLEWLMLLLKKRLSSLGMKKLTEPENALKPSMQWLQSQSFSLYVETWFMLFLVMLSSYFQKWCMMEKVLPLLFILFNNLVIKFFMKRLKKYFPLIALKFNMFLFLKTLTDLFWQKSRHYNQLGEIRILRMKGFCWL